MIFYLSLLLLVFPSPSFAFNSSLRPSSHHVTLPSIKKTSFTAHDTSIFLSKSSSTLVETDSSSDELVIDEEALVRRINEEIYAVDGVELEDLINPSKVVNLEREILQLNDKIARAKNQNEISKLNEKLEKAQKKLNIEKRSVMRQWLKNLFVGQSILAVIISLAMVYDVIPGYALSLPIRVLGFWMWWLFIIPSLR
jgi:hypothetical protein